jgi:hypothetical protein
MKRLLAIAALTIVTGACSSNPKSETATPTTTTVASTTTAPTTTVATTTATKPGSELGKTKLTSGGNTEVTATVKVTVFAYTERVILPQYRNDQTVARPTKGQKYVAILARLCLVSSNKPRVTLLWIPWTLDSDDGETYETTGQFFPDTAITPLYPDEKDTAIGQCRKGWIVFAIPDSWKPDFVEYAPTGSDALTWRLH